MFLLAGQALTMLDHFDIRGGVFQVNVIRFQQYPRENH